MAEAIAPKHSHGPISCSVIYARVGRPSTQWASIRDCCVGSHNDIGRAVKRNSCLGPPWECVALADELGLAQNMLEAIAPKHLHGPISCAVIYARVDPSSTQWASIRDCCVGPHILRTSGGLSSEILSVGSPPGNQLSLMMSSGWPRK